MVSRQVLRYYCSECSSLLKESAVELVASPSDLCPKCGSFLTESLHREKVSKNADTPAAIRTALDLSVPRFGIAGLDDLGIKYASSVCLTGSSSHVLFWRALVQSLLPRHSGGAGFAKILLVDAGNCSDIYLCVDYARQMGLGLNKLLDGIIVTRAFTVFQLDALARDLGESARRFGVQMVAIADIARMFASDPQIAVEETKLARRIARNVAQVSKHLPVMAFMSTFRSNEWLGAFEAVLQVKSREGKLAISIKKGEQLQEATVRENDVLVVRQI